jgi:hypothetical protein
MLCPKHVKGAQCVARLLCKRLPLLLGCTKQKSSAPFKIDMRLSGGTHQELWHHVFSSAGKGSAAGHFHYLGCMLGDRLGLRGLCPTLALAACPT